MTTKRRDEADRGRSRLRWLVVALVGLTLALAGASYAVAAGPPHLRTDGPTRATGTEATAVFRIGDRTVRQVRYDDRGTLDYAFTITNGDRLPVRITGISPQQRPERLFRYRALTDDDGARTFSIPAHGSKRVHLLLRMGGCESLSSRAGSFATSVMLSTSRARMFTSDVKVTLPEQLHTGSPREAFCPNSSASSRPPG